MRKRILPIVMALMLLIVCVAPVAANARVLSSYPVLRINGTKAECCGVFEGNKSSDRISITLTLKQGSGRVKSWSKSGNGYVEIIEECTVETGKTYELVLSATVNGVAQPDVSVTARS